MHSTGPSERIHPRPTTVFSPKYLGTTLGMFVLVFMVAFEVMAVTTAMPVISEALQGRELYALAFSAPLASGMVGMVAAGELADRRGPKLPLFASVLIFVVGLLICGVAVSMPMLVTGRLIQGVGGGAITVGIYVLIARLYPGHLHPKIFALFAAAWVLPALIGPWIAGLVATFIGWRWVFLGVLLLVVVAFSAVVPALRSLQPEHNAELGPVSVRRLLLAAATAVSVLAMSLLGRLPGIGPICVVVALAAALLALKPLLPAGTLRAARGLPATVLSRGLVAAAFFGTEVYLPYMLREDYALRPDLAGLVLTASALSWSVGSWLQGRTGERFSNAAFITVGSLAATAAIGTALATATWHLPVPILVAGWALGGFGMGLIYPRQNVNMLSLSPKDQQGFNSSAMTLADSLGSASATAVAGVVFVLAGAAPFAAVFALTFVVALAMVLVAGRTAPR
ncbi:MFS transporter [Glutamicibacter sp. PS]|uniref:MFS transporter n=1 Tax=Glutamicibacter sp. PS TaxID=3075634 RepID=UPI002850DB1C|nr:MFS transporter [Glutamicibacter sp. PS]MDR4534983.1 MFS transporter [Glutamicibacter sp. PS]